MKISPIDRPKSAAKRNYDRLSAIYDLLAGSSEAPLTRLGLKSGSRPGETVSRSAGTGRALVLLGIGWATGRVHGIDLSRMLRQAEEALRLIFRSMTW
jgi:hypothetical protein